jgi:hypothetical protein
MVVAAFIASAVSIASSLAALLATFLFMLAGESSDISYVGAALFLAGPLFFAITYAYYRNRSERHHHERETPVRMDNLQVVDEFSRHLTAQESPRIAGANNSQVEGSLVQADALSSLTGTLDSMLRK